MILIRGIKGDNFARKIENGLVGCRDVFSSLLDPPETGYEYSNYYEKNLVKALSYFGSDNPGTLHDPDFLYSLFIDPFIPHIYLTYFHILNEQSIEWLNKFDDDYSFIAINVKIDRNTGTAIGDKYFGAKMAYINDIRYVDQRENNLFRAACMCSFEKLFTNKLEMNLPLKIYNTLFFPLLCREQDKKFTDIENEFRFFTFDCPKPKENGWTQIAKNITLRGESGCVYYGTLCAGENTHFKSDLRILNKSTKTLREILLEEKGKVTLDSTFKDIDIRDISDSYKYIGGKKDCLNYIRQTLKNPPPDIYVNRTILKSYPLRNSENLLFLPGYCDVLY